MTVAPDGRFSHFFLLWCCRQDSDQALLRSSLGTPGGVIVDGDVTLEVDLVPAPKQETHLTPRYVVQMTVS